MGIREAWTALRGKGQVSPARYIDASVPMRDVISGRWHHPKEAREAVAHYAGWVGICASLNSSQVASTRLALYRRKDSGTGKRYVGGVGKVSDHQRSFMAKSSSKSVAEFARTGDDLEEITDGPLVDLLNQPNPDMTASQFWEYTQRCMELTGKAFHLYTNGKGRWGLNPLGPQYVKVMPGTDRLIESFAYGRSAEIEDVFDADEVAYYRHQVALDKPWEGTGPLGMILTDAQIDMARAIHNLALWQSGLSVQAVASFDPSTPEKSAKASIDAINANHRGPRNAGRLLGMIGLKGIENLSMTPRDMVADDMDDPTAIRIWGAFGVPESLLKLNDANLASSASGHVQYQRNTILPRVCNIADMITQYIIPEFAGLEAGEIVCSPDNPVHEDDTQLRATMQAEVAAGVITPNEYRQEFGHDPMEGGDELRNPNAMPMMGPQPTTISVPREMRSREPIEICVAAKSEPAYDPEKAREQCEDVVDAVMDLVTLSDVPSVNCCPKHTTTRDLWTKTDDIDNDPVEDREQEDPAYASILSGFDAIYASITAAMKDAPHGLDKGNHRQFVTKDDDDDLITPEIRDLLRTWGILNAQSMSEALAAELAPVVTLQLQESAAGSLNEISVEIDDAIEIPEPGDGFRLSRDPAVEAFENYESARSARLDDIAENMSQRLTATLADGLRAGETFDKLTARVEDEFFGDTDASGLTIGERRAAMIARTETAFAQGQGRLIGDMESGVVTGKRWRKAAIVCEFCQAADNAFGDGGEVVALGEPFYPLGTTVRGVSGGTLKVDFTPIQHPPLHPNCRCTYTREI